jgi:hypothetical protein
MTQNDVVESQLNEVFELQCGRKPAAIRLNVVIEVKLVAIREARELQDVVFVHFAEYNMWW